MAERLPRLQSFINDSSGLRKDHTCRECGCCCCFTYIRTKSDYFHQYKRCATSLKKNIWKDKDSRIVLSQQTYMRKMRYLSILAIFVVAINEIADTTAFVTSFTTADNKLSSLLSDTIHKQQASSLSMSTNIIRLAMSSSPNNDMDPSTLTLYGHPGTRSPLINWACYELGFDIPMASDLSRNPHPFGQLPCLTDDKKVVVFESGAILQYLHEHYSSNVQLTKEQRAAITSWIVWANASLDPICFLETPNGKVYDTGLRQPNRRIDQLNTMLSNQSYLVRSDDTDQSIFTIADVAIVSYLAYVLQFFPDVTIADKWPAIATYMQICISRPSYGQAFGSATQSRLLSKLASDINTNSAGNNNNPSKDKKLFGMF